MPYNDDAREPSSVTGRALGTIALVGALGGGGYLGMKGIKKGLNAGKNVIGKLDDVAREKGVYGAVGEMIGSTRKNKSNISESLKEGGAMMYTAENKHLLEKNVINDHIKATKNKSILESELSKKTNIESPSITLRNRPVAEKQNLNKPRSVNMTKVFNLDSK